MKQCQKQINNKDIKHYLQYQKQIFKTCTYIMNIKTGIPFIRIHGAAMSLFLVNKRKKKRYFGNSYPNIGFKMLLICSEFKRNTISFLSKG